MFRRFYVSFRRFHVCFVCFGSLFRRLLFLFVLFSNSIRAFLNVVQAFANAVSGVCVSENVVYEFVFAVFVVCFHGFNVWNGGFHILFRRNFSVNAGLRGRKRGLLG